MQANKNLSGSYNRRLEILRPYDDQNDSFNEADTLFEVVYSSYPARKIDSSSTESEKTESNLVSGSSTVVWEIRYIPTLKIKTNWRIKDIYDQTIYEISSPPTEIGHRQAIRIVAKIIQ